MKKSKRPYECTTFGGAVYVVHAHDEQSARAWVHRIYKVAVNEVREVPTLVVAPDRVEDR